MLKVIATHYHWARNGAVTAFKEVCIIEASFGTAANFAIIQQAVQAPSHEPVALAHAYMLM